MTEQDYYDILGISRTASAAEIRRAHRKLAKQYHPDRNAGDKAAEAKFKKVQEAYEVLNNPEKRKAYDRFGRAGIGGGGVGGHDWRSGPSGPHVYTWKTGGGPDIPVENLEDLFQVFAGTGGMGGSRDQASIFEQFFGGRRPGRPSPGTRAKQASKPEKKRNIDHAVTLSFEQAIHGTQMDLQITRPNGVAEAVSVKIPPGVADGQRIRIRGKGEGNSGGGPRGDLYIICQVQPHRYFRREGNDIYIDLPLTLTEAALGVKVEIPTLDGKTMLTVPPGTPSSAKLRLKSKGVKPPGNKPRGDQYAVVKIVPPKKPTSRQEELLKELREAGEASPRQDLGW